MKKTVYFEVFGKKMKTVVDASTDELAKQQVINKIIFHKIVDDNEPPKVNNTNKNTNNNYQNIFGNNDELNNLMNIFGFNKNK